MSDNRSPIMRITARLEPYAANQLEFLVFKLGLSTSDVLRKGLEALYEQHKPKAKHPFKHFAKHIGKYNLGPDASTNYKAAVADYLDQKYPRAPQVDEVREPLAVYGVKSSKTAPRVASPRKSRAKKSA
jgi:hypothetical protein